MLFLGFVGATLLVWGLWPQLDGGVLVSTVASQEEV